MKHFQMTDVVAADPTVASNAWKPYGRHTSRATPVGGLLKRAMDMIVAGMAIIALLPLFIGVGLVIRFSSTGPVFYGHNRIGFDGTVFKCWKFRSMVSNGDEVLDDHLNRSAAARLEWHDTLKLKDDPRVTPIGRVIRKLSIDELPQLFNILMGEMSVVGPRPVVAAELTRYGTAAKYYLRTRPGLTGLWQVSGRNDVSYLRRVVMDRFYVSHHSVLMDCWIVLRTIPAVLSSRGAS